MPQKFEISYFGARFGIELPHPNRELPVGSVMMTLVGKELARISGAAPVDGFPEHCIANLWARRSVTATRLS